MPHKDINKRKAAWRDWYARNRVGHIINVRRRRSIKAKENEAKVRAYKESFPCTDCGHKYPYYVVDFDHQHGKAKSKRRSFWSLVRKDWPWERIQQEINKCILRCSNCHRIKTFKIWEDGRRGKASG